MAVSAEERASAGGKAAVSSAQERKERQKLESKAAFDEQVATGELVIRTMSAAELEWWEARRQARPAAEAAAKATALEHRRKRASRGL
jgi:hypothetical protein